MVVVVLMMSCQIWENPNSGPVAAQIMTMRTAPIKASALPAKHDTRFENLSKKFFFIFITLHSSMTNRIGGSFL